MKTEVKELANDVNKKKILSVCVTAYNHNNFIQDCLRSIITQNCNYDFEVIVGDDESNDGCRETCISLAKKHRDKIRLLLNSRKNNIHINNRPTGRFNFIYSLISTNGKYVALCDGDDFWSDPHKLKKQIDFLEANPDVNICGHVTGVLVEDGISYNQEKRPNQDFVGRKLNQKEIISLITVNGPAFHTSSFVFRKSALTEFNLLANSTVGDYALLIKLTDKGFAYVLPDEMSVYRKTTLGFSHGNERDNFQHSSNKVIFFKSMNRYTSGKYKELFKPRIISGYKGLMRYNIERKNYLRSILYFLQLIRIDRRLINKSYELKGLFASK